MRAERDSYLGDVHEAVIQAEASPLQVTCWHQRGIPSARTASNLSGDAGIPCKGKNNAAVQARILSAGTFSPF